MVWSHSETHLLYVAEKKRPKTESYFQVTNADDYRKCTCFLTIYSMKMFFIWLPVHLNCRGLRRVCSLMKRRPSRQTRRKQSWYKFAIKCAIFFYSSLVNNFSLICVGNDCVCRVSSLSIMKTGVKHLWIKAAQCSVCWTSKAVTSLFWKEYPPTSPQDRYTTLCLCFRHGFKVRWHRFAENDIVVILISYIDFPCNKLACNNRDLS